MDQIISSFNPYIMQDSLIMAINTGREREMGFIMENIYENIKGGQAPQHILLNGPRGCGKSFLLRLIQAHLRESGNVCFVLFPEEQADIHHPAALLKTIIRLISEEDALPDMVTWFPEGRVEWERDLARLEVVLKKMGNPHVVLGIENLDLLFNKGAAFDGAVEQSLLMDFLSNTPWLTFIGATIYSNLEARYEKGLFQSFARRVLPPWRQKEHEIYLEKRNELEGNQTNPISLSLLNGLVRFTGAGPRPTVIMAEILSRNERLSSEQLLENLVDHLSPLYRSLLHRIPQKSKLLFHALILGGEPCSQSELAKRVGTAQNVISQGFNWLISNNYLLMEKAQGEKQKLYSIRDRLFAHFYRQRYILDQGEKSLLPQMAEFLTRFYHNQGHKPDISLFSEMEEKEENQFGGQKDLDESGGPSPKNALIFTEAENIPKPDNLEDAREILIFYRDLLARGEDMPEGFKGEEIAYKLFGDIRLSLEEKVVIAKNLIKGRQTSPEKKWDLLKVFLDNTSNQSLDKVGKIFFKLRDFAANGDIITEFMDNEAQIILKSLDEGIFYAFLVLSPELCRFVNENEKEIRIIKIWDLKSQLTSPSPELLVEAHEFILKRCIEEENILAQVWNLEGMGMNLQEIGLHEEGLEAYERAMDPEHPIKDEKEKVKEAEETPIKPLFIASEEIGKLVDCQTQMEESRQYEVIQKYADVVCWYCRKKEMDKAFSEGGKILKNLYTRREVFRLPGAFQDFFMLLLQAKVDTRLTEALLGFAMDNFGKNLRTPLSGIFGMVDYCNSNYNRNVLLKMEPEERITVEALLEKVE